MSRQAIIRAFDGSLADARGLLEVEKTALDESPYSPEKVRAMLSGGPQRAWVAVAEDRIVGFVIAFPTRCLRGPSWEIDLLAVHPDWSGRGLGTRLIRTASAHGARLVRRARAVVATDNIASTRAFRRVGFLPGETCSLLIQRSKEPFDPPPPPSGLNVWEASSVAEAANWLPQVAGLSPEDAGLLPEDAGWPPEIQAIPGPKLLLAEWNGLPAGYAELVQVQTLLYQGIWIESLAAPTDTVRTALVHEAVRQTFATGLNEIGMMVPEGNHSVREDLLKAGFQSLGEFRWLEARLPLPGLAGPGQSPPPAAKNDNNGRT